MNLDAKIPPVRVPQSTLDGLKRLAEKDKRKLCEFVRARLMELVEDERRKKIA